MFQRAGYNKTFAVQRAASAGFVMRFDAQRFELL
jgi:hypothetical protein